MEGVNEMLAELLVLKEQVKMYQARIEAITTWCKEQGPFSTDEYVCSIETRERRGLLSLEAATKEFGYATLEQCGLVTRTEYQVVTVSKKA